MMHYRGATRFLAGLLTAAMVLTGIPVRSVETAQAKSKTSKLSYKGYTKVWEDDFDGDSLNMNDWNIETHEPGWVNAELQEYTESGNYTVRDGKLTITPKKVKNADGTYSYSSARINTQNKHDFKYGIMEARMKFPKGQGYLPAFWMMPTNENLYGQWPKCGEIDIAEVMGQDTKKIYGTLHYGEPHAQSQGTKVLKKSDFSDDWHTCAVEWEPGSIKWYVDGVLYHEENSWYTKTPGQGEVTYPAPFDQNFYLIFNLAVGGSWVGYPDDTTSFDTDFQVDYVKVYQKKNYNENVKKPVKKVVLKKADKTGNFVSNASFAKNEKLDGSKNWQFLEAQSGVGSAAIKNKNIVISTKNAGKEDYSIQLVQPGLPMEKGAAYEVSFDAYAAKNRTMKVDISGPDMNYMRYFNDTTVNLTTKKKTYKFSFTMNEDTDANGRLEFNLGAQGSTADVHITNVKVKKTKAAPKNTSEKKTILADGNLVYNGKFQEGTNRLGYWKVVKKNAAVAVSNKDYNNRQLVASIKKDTKASDVRVYQTGLAFEKNKEYSVSFDAGATSARKIKVRVAGKTYTANLNTKTGHYEYIMKTGKSLKDKSIVFYLGGKKGSVRLDNVVVTENSLIKNGSFNAGTTGWTEWHDSNEADVSYVIDSLSEDNAADFTIKKTGSEDWKIQLKQENVPLVKDQYYKLSFRAKSSKAREMRAIMQGLEAKNWEVYSGENTVKLTSKYKTYTKVFKMNAQSDPNTQISFCLGAVGGKAINSQHRVCIDDVSLETISAKEAEKYLGKEPKTNDSMIKDGTFTKGMEMWSEWHEASEADAQYEAADNEVHFTINKTGSEDWKIQLKQENIKLEQGHYYRLVFDGKSDLERKVRATVQGGESRNYTHYTGEYFVTLKKDYQTYDYVFKMNEATDDKTSFQICMGAVDGAINKTHNLYFKNFSLTEISEEEGKKLAKNQGAVSGGAGGAGGSSYGSPASAPANKPAASVKTLDADTINSGIQKTGGAAAAASVTNGKVNITVTAAGGSAGDIQVPVAQVSNVKQDQVNKITIKASKVTGMVQSMRRSMLRAAGDNEVTVQFAIQFGNEAAQILKDADGKTDFELNDTVNPIALYYQKSDSAVVGNPKILCCAGTVPVNAGVLIESVQVQQAQAAEIPNNMSVLENAAFDGSYNQWVKSIVAPGSGSITFTEKKAVTTVTNPGTADWNVQLKQMGLPLASGENYEVKFTAKSDVARTIKASVMAVSGETYAWLNGADVILKAGEANTVTFYVKDMPATQKVGTVDVDLTKASKGIFFSMGRITDAGYEAADTPASTIEISDLSVKKVAAAGTDSQSNAGEKPNHGTSGDAGESDNAGVTLGAGMLEGTKANVNAPAETVRKAVDGGVEILVKNAGSADWNIQLLKEGISLEKGAEYTYSYKIKTDNGDWQVQSGMQDANYSPANTPNAQKTVTANATEQTVTASFIPTADDSTARFYISLGKFDGTNELSDGATRKVTVTGLTMTKTKDAAGDEPGDLDDEVNLLDPLGTDFWSKWCVWGDLKEEPNKVQTGNGQVTIGLTGCKKDKDSTTLRLGASDDKGLSLSGDKKYKLTFKVSSTKARTIGVRIVNESYAGYYADVNVTATEQLIELDSISIGENASDQMKFHIMLGLNNEADAEIGEHDITIKDIKLVEEK